MKIETLIFTFRYGSFYESYEEEKVIQSLHGK